MCIETIVAVYAGAALGPGSAPAAARDARLMSHAQARPARTQGRRRGGRSGCGHAVLRRCDA